MKILVFIGKQTGTISVAKNLSGEVSIASFEKFSTFASYLPGKKIKNPKSGADFVEKVVSSEKPDAVFFSDETIVRESAALFAGKNHLGLISHSNEVYIKQGKLIGGVPGWENLSAEVYSLTKPSLLVIHSNEDIESNSAKPAKIIEPESFVPEFVKVEEAEKNPLENARVIIGIGRGVSKNLFPIVEKIAKKIGAEIGCTRPVADSGLLPLSKVIGDSGIKIHPEIYIALGISGAIQHISGVNAKYIIAVNTDKNAPIFASSALPVLGKVENVLPELEKWIKSSL